MEYQKLKLPNLATENDHALDVAVMAADTVQGEVEIIAVRGCEVVDTLSKETIVRADLVVNINGNMRQIVSQGEACRYVDKRQRDAFADEMVYMVREELRSQHGRVL